MGVDLMVEEAAAVADLHADGVVSAAYLWSDEVVVVLDVDSIDAARQAVEGLPLVVAGVLELAIAPGRDLLAPDRYSR
jgi:hypothetical protein